VRDLIETIALVLAGATPRVEGQYPAALTLTAEGAATAAGDVPQLITLLQQITAAGVRPLFAWSQLPPAQSFCFAGGAGAGFGDTGNPSTGGGLAGITG